MIGIPLLVVLIYSYAREGRPGSPERAAREFINAMSVYDCDTAWRYFSSDSQDAIRRASQQYRNDPRNVDMMKYLSDKVRVQQDAYTQPQNFYCEHLPVFSQYRSSTVKLLRADTGTAMVAVKQGIPTNFLIPGFFPLSTRYEDRQLHLRREGKEWKIVFLP